MKIERVLLLGDDMVFSHFILAGLHHAFSQLGMVVEYTTSRLDMTQMSFLFAAFRPDLVLELNGVSKERLPLKHDAIHVGWLQEYQVGTPLYETPDCDYAYYLMEPEHFGYPVNTEKPYGVLTAGVDERFYYPGEKKEPVSDFTLMGSIPPVFCEDPKQREKIMASSLVNGVMTVGDFVREYWKVLDAYNVVGFSVSELHGIIERIIGDAAGCEFKISSMPNDLLHCLDHEYIRTFYRSKMVHEALFASKKLRLFGNPWWKLFPKFSPYYLGWILHPHDMREIYQTTRYNLHHNPNGWNMHFRVLDGMASGGVMVVAESPDDFRPGYLNSSFIPDVHFISCRFNEMEDLFEELVKSPNYVLGMGAEASVAVLGKHTWRHRVLRILADLKEAGYIGPKLYPGHNFKEDDECRDVENVMAS